MTAPRRAVRMWLPALAVVLLAATLRIAVASLSPVIDRIDDDLSLPTVVVGLIGATPPVAFGVFGFVTPALARRIPLERLALAAVVIAGAGILGRAFVAEPLGLLAWTVLAFAAIGVGNVVLPGLVKKYFPDRIGLMTTVYISAMSLATIGPPLVVVPIADAAGWRVALGVWAVVAVIAVGPWAALLSSNRSAGAPGAVEEPSPRALQRLLTLPRTWGLVIGFILTSGTAYSMFAWLPSLLRDTAGVDAPTAGILLAVFAGMGLPFSLFAPIVVARYGLVKTLFVAAVVPGLAGVTGLVLHPSAAPAVWVVLLSLPTLLFPVVITLVGLVTRTHTTTVALSGAVQSLGYGIAALFPIGMGLLHAATNGWTASLMLIGAMIATGIPAMLLVARPGTVEDDWEARHGRPW